MKGKLLLAAGMGIGYVLGSRAGRQSYESLKARAQELWNDPKVQDRVSDMQETVKEKAPVVQEKAEEALKTAGHEAKKAGGDMKSKMSGDDDRPGQTPTKDLHG
ncbi:YtxH domain-containing protein [Brevibacterium sp.]|uniref:YtxH domain-containing protein n=1 Tax=Brevibacterium sp. TaxID=1701 RepID=UPI0028120FED|nr:YtxH domain-containing protein [Brevibacterium sp.]